jgi:hypothetical protein
MPLPTMAGSDESLMGAPGMAGAMQQASPPDEGSQQVTPKDQAKGAVKVISKLRQANKDQLESIATQFPAVSKDLKDLLAALDRGIKGVVQKIIQTTQQPESAGPRIVR